MSTKEALEARDTFNAKWEDTYRRLAEDFRDQCHTRGHQPEWYFLASARITPDETLQLNWELRPEIRDALTSLARGDEQEALAAVRRLIDTRERVMEVK